MGERWPGLALLALVAVAVLACAGGERRHPNVLLVMIDSLRADHLHSYGYATAGFAGGPYLEKLHGLSQGFEHYDESVAVPSNIASHTGARRRAWWSRSMSGSRAGSTRTGTGPSSSSCTSTTAGSASRTSISGACWFPG